MLKKKLLVVGWDAADWQIINPLIKQGKLPALTRLLANGAHGNLATLNPPISPMLWTSIATGKRPYKHGVYGFTEATADGQKARPVRVTSRTSKAVWNILNENGLKTNVVGWWPSHPAEKVDGIMVSNFFGVIDEKSNEMPPLLPGTVHPEELLEDFADLRIHPNELTAEMVQPFFPDVDQLHSDDDEVLRSTMKILAHAASIHAAATYSLEKNDWDFAAVYYDALDHFSHIGMKFHPPRLKGVSELDFKKYHYIVEGAYRFHDMMLECLLDLAGDECNVLLVSDHGFINDHKRLLHLPEIPGAPALEHRPYGILLATGPDFKKGPVYGASLLDVAPTVLQLFGLPLARDFDGRPLNVLKGKTQPKWVETFESESKEKHNPQAQTAIDEAILKQLEGLGYIDSTSGTESPKTLLIENEYYRARSLADGGFYGKALHVMKNIIAAYPEVVQYNQFYAGLLLRTGEVALLEEFISNQNQSIFTTYLKGLLLLQKQRPLLALQEFDTIKAADSPAVSCQIAVALNQAGQPNKAAETIQAVLKADPENQAALNIAGDVYMKLEKWEEALSCFLKSIGLLFYQPTIHEKVGICLEHLGYYHDAVQALELALQFNPQNENARQLLIELLADQVSDPERLRELQSESISSAIVVTGFPRSGTSMMMQILKWGGLPILSDEKREKDDHNPKGYLELEAVKKLVVDDSFMERARGKAVKIVMPLLRLLQPNFPLKVIWMDRPLEAIVKSQQNMMGADTESLDLALLMKMKNEQDLMLNWLNSTPGVAFIRVEFDEAIKAPQTLSKKLQAFLGDDFDAAKGLEAVDETLKHF